MIHLMNSAMMPQEGAYKLRQISVENFVTSLCAAQAAGNLKTYIGYPQTADFLKRISGVEIPVNRNKTVLADGDQILIIRLADRMPDPTRKGEQVTGDFLFFHAIFRTLENCQKFMD